MKLKSEKGFTGIDMTIAIIILVIFTGIIATLFYNYNLTSKEIERKSKATEYAIRTIEEIKSSKFQIYENYSIKDAKQGYLCKDEKIAEQEGYYKTVQIIDYTDIVGNIDKPFGILKKVNVIISYLVEGEEKTLDISTVIAKEK